MKKTLIVLITLCLAVSAFASGAGEDGGYKGVTNKAFQAPLSLERGTLTYDLFTNPAALAENKLIVELPSVAVSDFNFAKTISSPSVAEAVSQMMRFKFTKSNVVRFLAGCVKNVGTGYNSAAKVDAELGVAIGKVGFALNAVVDVKSMPAFEEGTETPIDYKHKPQGLLYTGIVPFADVAATLAYGTRVFENNSMYINIGGSLRVIRRMYFKQLNASNLLEDGFDFNIKGTRGGFAFPFDLAAEVGLLDGKLKLGATFNNFNGYFYMQEYPTFDDVLRNTRGYNKYTVYTPWSANLSVEYDTGWKYVRPILTFRIEDINGFIQNDLNTNGGKKPWGELVTHLTARADIRIVKFINLNASFRNGYPEFGASVDIYGNTIEFAYGYHEAGTLYGEKPVDTFTLRVKLGFDNN